LLEIYRKKKKTSVREASIPEHASEEVSKSSQTDVQKQESLHVEVQIIYRKVVLILERVLFPYDSRTYHFP
jgi:hypothetical protein